MISNSKLRTKHSLQNTLEAEGAGQKQGEQQQSNEPQPLKTIPHGQLENQIDTLRETKLLDPRGLQLP